jgi:hypothetical protein
LEIHIQSFLFYAYKHRTLTEVPFGGGTLSSTTLSSLFSSDMFGCPGPETNMIIKSDFMQEHFMFLHRNRTFGYVETSSPDQQFSDFLM